MASSQSASPPSPASSEPASPPLFELPVPSDYDDYGDLQNLLNIPNPVDDGALEDDPESDLSARRLHPVIDGVYLYVC
jgi:hypothetical protein